MSGSKEGKMEKLVGKREDGDDVAHMAQGLMVDCMALIPHEGTSGIMVENTMDTIEAMYR